jgi:hypothetical protein
MTQENLFQIRGIRVKSAANYSILIPLADGQIWPAEVGAIR